MALKKRPRVLVVDRESEATKSLLAFLRSHDLDVVWARDGESGYNALDATRVDCLVTELRIHRIDGVALLRRARERNPGVCAVLIAERADVEMAVEAMRRGAADFQVKPVNHGKLLAVLRQGLERQTLAARVAEMEAQLDERFGLEQLTGRSRAIVRVMEQVSHIASTRATVLIEGETGTGKGLVARAIHRSSPRRDERFVWVNCGALAERVIESELFGRGTRAEDTGAEDTGARGTRARGTRARGTRARGTRARGTRAKRGSGSGSGSDGALTGANAPRRGRFELADGGTLFLDEIGELPPAVQVKLLRVLQDRSFERVGGSETLRVDVRLIVATNRDLAAEVAAGRFREDLFYRLSVVRIGMPPLRERPEDIPRLLEGFIREFDREHGRKVTGVTRGVLDRLVRYAWPGNVRQLRNTTEGMVVFAEGRRALDLSDLPDALREVESAGEKLELRVGMTVAEAERQLVAATLRHCGDDKPRAAAMLGIGLRTLYRKLKLH